MKPEQFLKRTTEAEKRLRQLKGSSIKVGILSGNQVKYPPHVYMGESNKAKQQTTGPSVMYVGVCHEFGIGVPKRSFLKLPFALKKSSVKKMIDITFQKIWGGEAVKSQLNLLAEGLLKIPEKAFETGGFGQWDALAPETVAAKGSSKILVKDGLLARSIASKVGMKG